MRNPIDPRLLRGKRLRKLSLKKSKWDSNQVISTIGSINHRLFSLKTVIFFKSFSIRSLLYIIDACHQTGTDTYCCECKAEYTLLCSAKSYSLFVSLSNSNSNSNSLALHSLYPFISLSLTQA